MLHWFFFFILIFISHFPSELWLPWPAYLQFTFKLYCLTGLPHLPTCRLYWRTIFNHNWIRGKSECTILVSDLNSGKDPNWWLFCSKGKSSILAHICECQKWSPSYFSICNKQLHCRSSVIKAPVCVWPCAAASPLGCLDLRGFDIAASL